MKGNGLLINLYYCIFIKASEASRRYRGRGPGRDRSDDVVNGQTPPTGMDQSSSNFQGVVHNPRSPLAVCGDEVHLLD